MYNLDPPDKLLDEAYAAAQAKFVSRSICIGALNDVDCMVPHLFDGKDLPMSSLRHLQTKKNKELTNFTVKVMFCVGLEVKNSLYQFFDALLYFQDPSPFYAFLKNGFALFLTGGVHSEIIAAVTFMVAPDGVFIDALAVSHGRGRGPCKLNSETFGITNAYQKLRRHSLIDGSFQNFKLGSLLMGLVERCAQRWCTVKGARVYVKMNKTVLKFYQSCGYQKLPSDKALPSQLLAMVPAFNVDSSSSETSIMSKPARNKATYSKRAATVKSPPEAAPAAAKKPSHVAFAMSYGVTE